MKKQLLYLLVLLSFSIVAQPTSWSNKGIGGGGALFRPSINPANPDEYYVPTDMGPFFHTTDFGKSYSQLSFLTLNGGAWGLIRYTNNPNIKYAIGSNPSGGATSTVYKTIDNGVTWVKLPCIANSSAWQSQGTVHSLFVDFNNPLHLVFSTRDAMYCSLDGGTTMNDISQTTPWYQFIGGALFDGNNIYLGTPGGVVISTNGGVNFSKANLTGIPAGNDIAGFAAAKQGNTIRFFCTTIPTGILTMDEAFGSAGGLTNDACHFNGLYSIDYNSSTAWVSKTNGLTIPGPTACYPCDYILWIGMAQNDINTVYAGGANGNAQAMMVKSTDAGSTWNQVFKITNNQNINTGYAGDKGDLWQWYNGFDCMDVCATNYNYIVQTSMGFIHVSKDGGSTWDQAYVAAADMNPMNAPTPKNKNYHSIGIEPTSNWYVTWADQNKMIYSFTDIGCVLSTDGGNTMKFPSNFTDNTLYCALKGNNGKIYGAVSNAHDMYINYLQDKPIDNSYYSNGKLMYSNDDGYTWQTLKDFGRPVYWIAFDPNNQNKMYASVVNHTQGLGGVYVTSDLNNGTAATWTKLPNPPRTEGHTGKIVPLKDGKIVCTYGPRQLDWNATPSGKFTKSSGVFIYDPNTNAWTDVSDLTTTSPTTGTPGIMGWWCNDIYVDPNDPSENTWYVGVSAGYGWTDANGNVSPNNQGSLMKTTNRGQTWKSIFNETHGLTPGGGVYSVTLNPNNPNEMYVSTNNSGLWISKNINSSTPTFTQLTNFPFAFPLRVFFNPYNQNEMWVTTFGNGIYVGTITSTGIANKEKNNSWSIYPNPSNGIFNIDLEQQQNNSACIISNILGEEIMQLNVTNKTTTSIDLSGYSKGLYFITLNGKTKKIVVK